MLSAGPETPAINGASAARAIEGKAHRINEINTRWNIDRWFLSILSPDNDLL
jgi:hypothetical protein